MIVVCDDTKTAPAYFKLLAVELKAKITLRVIPKPYDRAGPRAVVEKAVRLKDDYFSAEDQSNEGGAANNQQDESDQQAVWALVDLEVNEAQRRSALEACESGRRKGIGVALSKPCFEVWTLLHLVGTNRPFHDCNEVLKAVKKEWYKKFSKNFVKKAQADYRIILPDLPLAMARAKRYRERDDQSWTEVYKVIECINRFVSSTELGT